MKASAVHPRITGDQIVRFNVSERIEHFLMMVAFTMLVVTGLPQKLSGMPWAASIVLALGGIDSVRLLHRVFAAIFTIQAFYHLSYVTVGLMRRRLRPSMVPQLKDVLDAWHMLRYCLGLTPREPHFGRFTYREKFEYWGVVLGAVIMVSTGIVLWFPTFVTQILPGDIVPAAKEAHGGEALLAFLVIVVWHLYGVHLSPLRFPGDISIFTGRISRKRMLEEHPLEYAQMMGLPLTGVVDGHEEAPVATEAPHPSASRDNAVGHEA